MFLQECKDKADKAVELLSELFTESQMNEVCTARRRPKNIREFFTAVAARIPDHNEDMFRYLSFDDVRKFVPVIDFSECKDIPEMSRLLSKMHKTYPKLRAKSLDAFLQKCHEALAEENAKGFLPEGINYPSLNWCPNYGGLIAIKLRFNAAFRRWAIQNRLVYLSDGETLVMNMSDEAKYAAAYDQGPDVQDQGNEPEVDPNLLQ